MVGDLDLRCACGAVAGVLRRRVGERGRRLVCYCDDCQAFTRFLGRADVVLDVHGGTDIVQCSPAQVEIRAGREAIGCLRLSPRGLLRWYAQCCRWPIGNTLATPRLPVLGLITAAIDPDASRTAREEFLAGRPRGVFGRHAKGEPSDLEVARRAPLDLAAAITGDLIARCWRGDHRRSPFFDADGEPIARPQVLSAAERAALANAASQ